MKDFSIIIPAYNVEKYIKRCVDSVLNQTYKNYEVIIVNDGSTDNTLEVIKKYNKKRNIKIIDKENGGLSSARNAGIKNTNGKYLIFLDSDDWWEKDLLKKLKEIIDKEDVDIVCFKLQKYFEKEDHYKVIDIPYFSSKSGIKALQKLIESHKTFETAVTFAFKSEFWNTNQFNFSEGKLHEDFGLIPYVIACAKKVISIDYVGYNYYIRENSIMTQNDYDKVSKKCLDTLEHVINLKKQFANLKMDNYSKELIANYLMNAIIRKTINLELKDQKKVYKKLKDNRVYELFNNGSLKSFIKYVVIKINPKYYKFFV